MKPNRNQRLKELKRQCDAPIEQHPNLADMRWLLREMEQAEARGYERGLSDALEIAKYCGDSYVENPAIDMYERMRRSGIRWCGEFIVSRIRALLQREENKE